MPRCKPMWAQCHILSAYAMSTPIRRISAGCCARAVNRPHDCRAVDQRDELAASNKFIELHFDPLSEGRLAGYRIGDQSAGVRASGSASGHRLGERCAGPTQPQDHPWKSRNLGGRPPIDAGQRALIRQMSIETVLWGAPQIQGELLRLGFAVAQSTVAKYMAKRGEPINRDHAREHERQK